MFDGLFFCPLDLKLKTATFIESLPKFCPATYYNAVRRIVKVKGEAASDVDTGIHYKKKIS